MGWFDAPAGQANLLAGMSNIASHKIAEPNIGSAITSGLGKAVDAIKTRNDTLIKEEANAKVREILAQPMDAKNPMATQQLLAQWLPRADEKHQMIGKDAIANAYQGANYQTGQERLGLEKDRFANQKEVSERDFKQRQLEHSDMIKHQKVLENNSAAQLGLSQKQYEMALESSKLALANSKATALQHGMVWDDAKKDFNFEPNNPVYMNTKYLKERDNIKSVFDKIDTSTYQKNASATESLLSYTGFGNVTDATHAEAYGKAKTIAEMTDTKLKPLQSLLAEKILSYDSVGALELLSSPETKKLLGEVLNKK